MLSLYVKTTQQLHIYILLISIYPLLQDPRQFTNSFGCPVLPQEMSEPSPVDWPRGMGLSRESDSRLALNEWNAQVYQHPTPW